jgi:Ca2+-binding EF-hand superfamily protein
MSKIPLRYAPRPLLAAAAFGLLVMAGGVSAGLGGHDAKGHGKDHARPSWMMKQLDLDGDGVISRDEFDVAIARRFARLDTDADGTLSFEQMHARRAPRSEDRARLRFDRIDTDGDGRISIQEFTVAADRRFARMDRNGDGLIQADELTRPRHARWSRGQAN